MSQNLEMILVDQDPDQNPQKVQDLHQIRRLDLALIPDLGSLDHRLVLEGQEVGHDQDQEDHIQDHLAHVLVLGDQDMQGQDLSLENQDHQVDQLETRDPDQGQIVDLEKVLDQKANQNLDLNQGQEKDRLQYHHQDPGQILEGLDQVHYTLGQVLSVLDLALWHLDHLLGQEGQGQVLEDPDLVLLVLDQVQKGHDPDQIHNIQNLVFEDLDRDHDGRDLFLQDQDLVQ